MKNATHLLLSLTLLTMLGCNSGPGDMPEVGQVTGKVTLDGEPLPNARVYFWPKEGGRESEGVTDESGNYELQYNADTKGTKIGVNVVRVVTATEEQYDDEGNVTEEGAEEKVPAKYNEESELEVEVKAGDNDIPLDLTTS